MHALVEQYACLEGLEAKCAKGAKFLPFGRNQVRQPKVLSAAEHGWGGRPFGCRSCPRKETFVSVWDFRPPKVPPNMHEFRLCLGVSAAEGAAEPA